MSSKHFDSFLDNIQNAMICISLDRDDNLKILKSRYGDLELLNHPVAFKLISKILSNIVYTDNETLKLFKAPFEVEIMNCCTEIFNRHLGSHND